MIRHSKNFIQSTMTSLRKKNYQFECKRIESFLKYKKNVKHILEIGCGTCSHSILLSEKGYNIIGIDNSYEMIKVAKDKIKQKKINNIILYNHDAEKLNTITKKESLTPYFCYLM